jgi:hypothetical protein
MIFLYIITVFTSRGLLVITVCFRSLMTGFVCNLSLSFNLKKMMKYLICLFFLCRGLDKKKKKQ